VLHKEFSQLLKIFFVEYAIGNGGIFFKNGFQMVFCDSCKINPRRKERKECHSCITARHRALHPCRAAYDNLKSNAKRRGHGFDLTYQEFENFAIATDYIANKGRTVNSYSIDRIDNTKGYSVDNIGVLTVSENSKKHTKKVCFDIENRAYYVAEIGFNTSISEDDIAPF
jgi:hypothetical protein